MNTKLKLAALLLALSTVSHQLSIAFAQGALSPTAAPAASMKSLDQIYARTDARIPITNSASTVTISVPGSYYLTTNLTVSSGDGIVIATNNVSLDLNGYTIRGTAASAAGYGIKLTNAVHNITIANGFIESGVTNNGSGVYSGSGFAYGIFYSVVVPVNVLVSRVSVSGCLNYGIYLDVGDSMAVVEACTVRTIGGTGIYAKTIKQSLAVDCGGAAAIYGDHVSDCSGKAAGSAFGYGVYATYTAQNCYGASSGNSAGVYAIHAYNCYGISVGSGGVIAETAQNCYGGSSTGSGIVATTAQNCQGSSGGNSYGVSAAVAQNCYGFSASGYGLYASQAAVGCYGGSNFGTGIYAMTAAFCVGSRLSGTAIQATVANGCFAANGTNLISYKYNMP